jgi:carbamoyl-phosphate synthase large subunit
MHEQMRVLITGVGGPAGKAAAYYFKHAGYFVVGVDMNPDVEANVDVFHAVHPSSDLRYVPQLIALAKRYGIRFLLPTVSEELPKLSLERERFMSQGIFVLISRPYAVFIANDKYLTCMFMKKMRVPVPEFYLPQDIRRRLDEGGKGIHFPILAKPRVGRGGRGIIIYENEQQLKREKRRDIFYQEFIPGEEYDLNLFIEPYPPYRILASRVLRKVQMEHGKVGNAIVVQPELAEDVRWVGERAAIMLGLTGPVDMDIRRRENGQPVLLEINARLGANSLAAPEVLEQTARAFETTTVTV